MSIRILNELFVVVFVAAVMASPNAGYADSMSMFYKDPTSNVPCRIRITVDTPSEAAVCSG